MKTVNSQPAKNKISDVPASPAKTYQEPKRLSKAGQWRRDNPGGIYEIIDRRAVNR